MELKNTDTKNVLIKFKKDFIEKFKKVLNFEKIKFTNDIKNKIYFRRLY